MQKLNSHFIPERLNVVTAFFASGPQTDDVSFRGNGVAVVDRTWDQHFDFVFVDGNHSYEAVKRDFSHAVDLLKPGGVIVFHDALSWEGVNRFLNELADEYAGRAVVEVIGESDRKWLRFLGQSNDGIGVFRLIT